MQQHTVGVVIWVTCIIMKAVLCFMKMGYCEDGSFYSSESGYFSSLYRENQVTVVRKNVERERLSHH